MLRITGFSVLLRAGAELPPSLIIKRDELTDGWSIVGPGGARRLEKRIRSCRWHFIRIADESLRSGVGESSQQAIVCALKLVVRGFSDYFNAAEVRHIHLTKYPWFVLARVGVYPCRIQQGPVQFVPDDALPIPARARRRQLPVSASLLFPQFGREMPTLKEMLIQSGNNYRWAQ
jgi:hypothetical protein